MAEITAKAVNEFRKATGLGLMECKALLQEAQGDLKQAMTLAQVRGKAKAGARAGRATRAGRLEVAIAPDGRSGAIVELGCETDFVARNDEFRRVARELAEQVLAQGETDLANQASTANPSKTVADTLVELNARTGENILLPRAARFALKGPGRVDAYIHHDGKAGALVAVDAGSDEAARSEAVGQLVKDLAMQIVAAVPPPVCVRRDEMPADLVAEQKQIFIAQAGDKPEAIREKIATGKLDAWFGENTLLDQPFVKDSAQKIAQVVATASKAAGGVLTVERFVRYVVGDSAEASAEPDA